MYIWVFQLEIKQIKVFSKTCRLHEITLHVFALRCFKWESTNLSGWSILNAIWCYNGGWGKWDANGPRESSHKNCRRAPVNLCQYSPRGAGSAWQEGRLASRRCYPPLQKICRHDERVQVTLAVLSNASEQERSTGEVTEQINLLRRNK